MGKGTSLIPVVVIAILVFSLLFVYYDFSQKSISNEIQFPTQIVTATSISTTATVSKPTINISSLEPQIHALINQQRALNGLDQLSYDINLVSIARYHSQDMAENNYFSHTDLANHDFVYRYQMFGYACKILIQTFENGTSLFSEGAENLAQNNLYDSITYVNGVPIYNWNTQNQIAASTVSGWMNSTGHRENILTYYWKNEGIGVAIASDGKVYITENFC